MSSYMQLFPFYHSYKKPYLAFLVDSNATSTMNSVLSFENNHEVTLENINLISILELDAPTQNPVLSLAIIMPTQLFFVALALFIQTRTLQMLKQEKSVNNKLMVTQAWIHMLFWPAVVIAITLTDNIYPLSAFTSDVFCSVLSFIFYFCGFSFILYSFYASLLRYLLCLYTERVNKFGKHKLITIIYCIFYLHTFLWALYTLLTSFNMDHTPLINSCYGYDDRVFLMEKTAFQMAQRHFCTLGSDEGKKLK